MMGALKAILGRNSDLALVTLVMGVLVVLFAPTPAPVLDLLLILNFSLALLILLLTFYAPRPVEFSTFPALLLIATLFRLALNVSATRLILSEGDAGRVIAAVGTHVVGDNYVIGMIVFLILVVVQYVVVTNGAQRVSEVAARFTLDSMPGHQMSIDADLNMGFIDQEEAKRRRKTLEREATFYGAMDGASKFVKGDAIASILIMLINIVGGLVIGVLQQGMPWGEALHHYTLLTIGDGIVTQIPALVISVGTGVIVTRSSSDSELSAEVLRQLTAFPRTLAIVAIVVLSLGALPGIPLWPVLLVAALGGISYFLARSKAPAQALKTDEAVAKADDPTQDPYKVYDLEPIEVELGRALAAQLGGEQGVLMERVAAFRTQFAAEMGIVVPKVRFKEATAAEPEIYSILIFGETVASGRVMTGKTLAIHPTGDLKLVRGIETREPTYGLPALWIDDADRDAARLARYTLVDSANVLFTHLCEVIRARVPELLTRAETDRLLARLRGTQPGLVEELIPTVLSVSDVQRVLQNLAREKVSIRNLQGIVETLVDGGRSTKDTGALTELVRQRLANSICGSLSPDRRTLHVLTLDPKIEASLIRQASGEADGTDSRAAEKLLLRIASNAERMMKANLVPVMLCSPELRRHLRALCERATPHLRVLSMAEIASGYELRAFASVGEV
jgi:flagellar biosynthesis protein FlhA